MAMSYVAKRNIMRRFAKIAAVVILGIIGFFGYRFWQYYQFMDETQLDEDIAIEKCIGNWGGHIEVSREIEARLQQAMLNPQRYIVMKIGDRRGSYWFGFFGIDKTRGYLLTNSERYTELIEKSYARKEAETLFDELTRDYDALDDYSDILSFEPTCAFIKVAFPTTSKQVRIIGSTWNASEDDVSVILEKNAFQLLFNAPIAQAISNQTLEERHQASAAVYQRERNAGHKRADYQNQGERAAENIFFELPGGK